MRTKKTIIPILLIIGWFQIGWTQDLLDLLEKEQQDSSGYMPATFKMTRIAIGHSTEVRSQGVLDIFATNRFWNLPKERRDKNIALKLNSRIALEYGISDRLTIGVGGSTFEDLFDGHLKYKLLAQKKGLQATPINITLFQSASYISRGIGNQGSPYGSSTSDRLSFTSQVLLSRRISSNLSIQLAPTFIHKGFSFSSEDQQDFYALGIGARYKVGNHLSLVSEYYKTFNPISAFETYSPFAIGLNWEIGDVMLQFMLTNAVSAVEDSFIAFTRNTFDFKDPNLNFGFNATYVIHFKNKLKKD